MKPPTRTRQIGARPWSIFLVKALDRGLSSRSSAARLPSLQQATCGHTPRPEYHQTQGHRTFPFKPASLRPLGHSHHLTLLQGCSIATQLALRPSTCRRVPCSALSAATERGVRLSCQELLVPNAVHADAQFPLHLQTTAGLAAAVQVALPR